MKQIYIIILPVLFLCITAGTPVYTQEALVEKIEEDTGALSGFKVGINIGYPIITGEFLSTAKKNNLILAIPSNGVHSNGYSLVKYVIVKKKINFYLDLKLDDFNSFNFHPLVNTATINIKRSDFYKLLKKNNIVVHLFNFKTYDDKKENYKKKKGIKKIKYKIATKLGDIMIHFFVFLVFF